MKVRVKVINGKIDILNGEIDLMLIEQEKLRNNVNILINKNIHL